MQERPFLGTPSFQSDGLPYFERTPDYTTLVLTIILDRGYFGRHCALSDATRLNAFCTAPLAGGLRRCRAAPGISLACLRGMAGRFSAPIN